MATSVPARTAAASSHGATRTRAPSIGTSISPMVSAIGLQTSQAMRRPSGTPSSEPTSPWMAASLTNSPAICRRVAPSDRRMPTSCRRSATVTDRML